MVDSFDLIVAKASLDSHSEVGDGSEGSNEGSQDVEQAFLLEHDISIPEFYSSVEEQELLITYHWDTECHCVESERGDEHNDEDNPDRSQHTDVAMLEG